MVGIFLPAQWQGKHLHALPPGVGGWAMTVVVGKCFDERIVIASDTMISDANTGNANAIPGRLKAIIISDRLSIAYAGHSDPALHAIRRVPDIYTTGGIPNVLEALKVFTASKDYSVDFMIAYHDPHSELRRVWNGQVSAPLQQVCIGNYSIIPEVLSRFVPAENAAVSAKNFIHAFLNAFTDRQVFAGTGVGGFPILLEAQPAGHIYRGHTFSMNWKPVVFKPEATTYENDNDLLTGEWSFRHDILVPRQSGLAVLAAEVPQAKVGFVYAPLVDDEPEKVTLLGEADKWTEKQTEMHQAMQRALNMKISQVAHKR